MKSYLYPFGMSGARKIETLARHRKNRGLEYGMEAICNGHFRILWNNEVVEQAVKLIYKESVLSNRNKQV